MFDIFYQQVVFHLSNWNYILYLRKIDVVAVEVVIASVLHADQPHDEQVGRPHKAAYHPNNWYDKFELVFRHSCSRTQQIQW